ncbi:MAG: dihydrodipicolinate reductase [Planctomycetes bacterium]|nr:dihydrodipicolinate reductase [Planctomycetota bacterium]
MNLRLLHVGLGPLGLRIQTDLLARRLGATVAVVDPAPQLAGRMLSEFVPGAPAVRIHPRLEDVPDFDALDAAIVTTSSDLRACADTFRGLLDRGVSVVSSCEELIYPWLRHRALAQELDLRAKESGAQLLGTGVNPGFLMDALPVFASAVCNAVRSLSVQRIQDATTRRVPFQKKIGAGLDRASFDAAIADGWLRHVGLGESIHFCAHYLGYTVESWSETIEPVLATRELECKLGRIPVGHAAGVRQVATGIVGGEPRLRFEFQAAIAQPDPHDRVVLEGDPPIDLVIRGGVHGDVATSAIVLNALTPTLAAAPGLHTMATIPMVACSDAGRRR